MENPFVHLIKMPEETDICFIGKENVKPSSLLSCEVMEPSSLAMSSFNDDAIKSKRSCKHKIQFNVITIKGHYHNKCLMN
jgi:hypothetical protein